MLDKILTCAATSAKIPAMNALARFLWLCVWLGLAFYLVLTLWLGLTGLVYPYQLDYGEGIVLWFAQQLAHGQTIYKGLSDFPYASNNYPPVAMLLSAALMPIFGDGYASGRLLNLASALIIAGLIFRIVQTETRSRSFAAIAALFFLGSPYVYHWIPLFRVDLMGLAFAVGGIYVVWRWEQPAAGNRQRLDTAGLLLATACFLLALYTKHTLFAAPAAAFFSLWMRNKRTAIFFALALGAVGGAIYLLLDSVTRGGFTFGLLESNATIFLPDQLSALLKNFALTFPILLLLALWFWLERVRAKRFGVLEWYAVTAFAALVLAGRVGAWENYFFEAIAITCVFAFLRPEFKNLNSKHLHRAQVQVFQIHVTRNGILNYELRIQNFILPTLLFVQLALMWHDPRIAAELMARDLPANQQLASLLQQTPGIIISEDMGALATNGKAVAYYTFQYSSLARSGKWDQRWELDGLRYGAFPLVILERGTREDVDHYRRFTREFVSALDRYYSRTQTLGKYEIYRPAPALRLQSADFGDGIALVGWHTQPAILSGAKDETLNSGTLNLTIVWQAKRVMDRRYTAFVHLEKSDGGKVTQDDREPRGGIYPTTRWAANEMVREVYTLLVPSDLPTGKYVLKIGWYDSETGDRLAVPKGVDDSVVLK